jgi:hypothetical protein
MNINTNDIAWCAGFFDGEGTTFTSSGTNSYIVLSITQNDPAVLEKFSKTTGMGKIYGPYPRPNGNPFYTYKLERWADVQYVVALMWKFLGDIKRKQAISALSRAIKPHPKFSRGASKTCIRFHPSTPDNINKFGQCIECCRIRDRIRWERDKDKTNARRRELRALRKT